MPPTREQLLGSRVGELAGTWLYVRCPPPCTKTSYLPLKMLAKRHGHRLLSAVLPRLKCEHCHQAPLEVRAVDHPFEGEKRNDGPRVATWSVTLVP